MFGGAGGYADTQVIELSKYMYTVVNIMCVLNMNSFQFSKIIHKSNWKLYILNYFCFVLTKLFN